MEEIVLAAKRRTVVGKQVKALRREGYLPAVIYGRRTEPVAISLDYHEANLILPTVTTSQLLVVDIEGEQHHALIRERQRHPVRGTLLHVDFLGVSMTEKLRAEVMLELDGESPAVENESAILVTGLESVEVESLPADLPERILVDISAIKEIGDALYVKDLVLPPKITILSDPDEMVVLATYTAEPIAEEEEEVEEEFEASEPEVIERGKREEEEEE